ncbi:MAG: nucleoside-diphosphate kinase [Elusimicrobia bacterium]|nr:nucleoside-diphosphate kinase [Elusimicrobiota bacterium]
MKQQALVIIKPDGLKKSLTGSILTKLSESKLEIIGAKVVRPTRELTEKHYSHMKDKPFFEDIVKYFCGDIHRTRRILLLVYQGESAIEKLRSIAGSTNPEEAEPTTIRGSYGRITTKGVYENVLHVSGNDKEAEQEIKLWFLPSEIVYEIYPTKEVVKEKVDFKEWA